MKLLAIDPSNRKCGWAYFKNGKLNSSGTEFSTKDFPKSSEEIAWHLYERFLTTHFDQVVIEYPTYERSLRGKVAMLQGHILNLAYFCGRLSSVLSSKNLHLPTPIQWKGNVPKEITQRRVKQAGYKFSTPDEADAIALGLWALERIAKS